MHPATNRVFLILLTTALLVGGSQAAAQTTKTTVEVHHTGDDVVGKQLAFEVREALRRSAAFTLLDQGAEYQLKIATVDIETGTDRGYHSAASVTFLTKDARAKALWWYLTASVYVVGGKRITDVASSVIATLDEEVSDLNRASATLRRKQ